MIPTFRSTLIIRARRLRFFHSTHYQMHQRVNGVVLKQQDFAFQSYTTCQIPHNVLREMCTFSMLVLGLINTKMYSCRANYRPTLLLYFYLQATEYSYCKQRSLFIFRVTSLLLKLPIEVHKQGSFNVKKSAVTISIYLGSTCKYVCMLQV